MLEQLLIDHCAPTLAGLKMASLFRCVGLDRPDLEVQLSRLNQTMASKGIALAEIKSGVGGSLIYVYRKKNLETALQKPEAQQFLAEYGYIDFNAEGSLAYLKERLAEAEEFPHEIGVFLGYPMDDIKEFIKNKGKNSKCTGCWKVYCNECEARKTFARYEKCRCIYQRLFSEGRNLLKLTVAA